MIQHAITFRNKGISHWIITPDNNVQLSANLAKMYNVPQVGQKYKALWDTGASRTCVSNRLADDLKLPSTGIEQIHGAGGIHDSRVFTVDLNIMGLIQIQQVEVMEFIGNGAFDILIGMDIITIGDLTITNANKQTVFTFRVPAGPFHVDYVQEINKATLSRAAIKKFNKRRK